MSRSQRWTAILVAAVAVAAVSSVAAPARKPASSAHAKRTVKAAQEAKPAAKKVAKVAQVPKASVPAKLARLVDLGANRCIPCKMMAPILEELRQDQKGKLEVTFIDVWENPAAGRQYGIRVIPTQVFYDAQGKEFYRHEGFMPKADIVAKFREHGIRLAEASARK
jgi:thioredoxin 1